MLVSESEPFDVGLRDSAVDLLLASTLGVPHDGTITLRDGQLPQGVQLPLGVARNRDGSFDLLAFSDAVAPLQEQSPTRDVRLPLLPIAGDDLVVLAARNDAGVHVNAGMEAHLRISARLAEQIADRVQHMREEADIRVFDERTLVSVRAVDEPLDAARSELLSDELRRRGVRTAYLAEYAVHDESGRPGEFSRLVVVGDEAGEADFDLREDARMVVTFVMGERFDSVACDQFPKVAEVASPFLRSW